MKRYLTVILCLVSALANAQQPDTISLEWCNKQAVESYPLSKHNDLLNKSSVLRMNNLDKNYLPQLYLNGQASYQSEVTELPVKTPLFSIPTMDKDMYKASLDVNQVIFDGRQTVRQKELEEAGLAADQQNLVVELYKLKERVNQVYFSILIFQENEKILRVLLENLNSKLSQVNSGVLNGTLLESNADILQAEILKAEQQLTELDENRKSGLAVLEIFIGHKLSSDVNLGLPAVTAHVSTQDKRRPEFLAFDLQKKRIETSKDLMDTRSIPRLTAFGEAGYGRPGLNMLKNEFASFYMVGVKLSWNIWNWNQVKNDKQIADYHGEMIDAQKESFDENLRMSLKKNEDEANKIRLLIKKDEEIIALREKVTKTLSAQLDNGVITATEYLNEYNNEVQARINLQSHRIQLVRAEIDYLTTNGSY